MGRMHCRGFVSYARDDGVLVERLLKFLEPRGRTRRSIEIELWSDASILAGEDWRQQLERALDSADFGLLCVSPSFLDSPFVTDVELPALMQAERIVIPLALEPLDFAAGDLKGLGERQIFRLRRPSSTRSLAFAECGAINRQRFCDALVTQIEARCAQSPPSR